MNEMDQKAPGSHECQRQFRLHKQREEKKTQLDLPVRQKRNVCRRLQLQREARKRLDQSRLPEEGQEAQKQLKAERQRDVSRRQCKTAEKTARRLLDQNDGNVRRHDDGTTTTKQPAKQEHLHNQQNCLQRRCEQNKTSKA